LEGILAKKDLPAPGSALLPTVAEPGTYEWCEEVVECITAAWRTREGAEAAFLAAVGAAHRYRIWEQLSPPPPEEPITSLDGLIRRVAEPDQAEPMQIAIRFSGVLEEEADRPGRSPAAANLAAGGAATGQVSAPAPGAPSPARALSEEEEIAQGNALLDQYASAPPWQPAEVTGGSGSEQGGDAASDAAGGFAVGLPAPAPEAPRRTAAQRKRDRLERTHPELAEAVDSGEMTLKQAYLQAGIEREVRTLDKLQRLWRAASEEERDHFLSWVEQDEGVERRREYERQVYGDQDREVE
jgi:hypothetical protein